MKSSEHDANDAAKSSSACTLGRPLFSRSFVGLLTTQLLGTVNDNIFRWLVIGIGKRLVSPDDVSLVLTIGTVTFVGPYIILAAVAGYLADRFSKRQVIVGCKIAELFIMAAGTWAVFSTGQSTISGEITNHSTTLGNIWPLFVVLGLMGSQSALFSPSKLGSIPEILRVERISAANGWMGLTTVIATVIGTAIGNVLADFVNKSPTDNWILAGAVILSIAVMGWLASLLIERLPAINPLREFPYNLVNRMLVDMRTLVNRRVLLRVAMGTAFFWSLGTMANLNIDQFAVEGGTTTQSSVVPLLIALVVGVGAGSVLAGVLSGDRIELGLLPLGAAGVSIGSILLWTVEGSLIHSGTTATGWTAGYVLACVYLVILGFSAGLFEVPLASFLQHRSPPNQRGSILAATNLLTFMGILLVSWLFWLLRIPVEKGEPLLSARQIFLVCGIMTLPVFIYVVCLIPQATIRFLVWLATHTVYRIRVHGRENLPERGGALLISNHPSWLDGVMLLLISSRPVGMVVYAGHFQNRIMRWLADLFGAILLPTRPKALMSTIKTTRERLRQGELVCIFPEGEITRTGQLQGFKPGVMKIHKDSQVPIIPIYLDELWGSIFSFESGRFFWKWPRRWPFPISIHIGEPIHHPQDVHHLRQSVETLGAKAVEKRSEERMTMPRLLLRQCKSRKWKQKVADSSGMELTGGQLLMRMLILRRLLNREVLSDAEQNVGVFLPPSAGAVVTNGALALSSRTSVNLNYTVTSEVLNHCIQQCQIKHVLTSRRFMEKMDFQLDAELVYLEDFKDRVGLSDKLCSFLSAFMVPSWLLDRQLGLNNITPDDVLTMIFTSGSTGQPKGVMLTHSNIGSNIEAIEQVINLNKADVLVGILPFFHSFGYTVTMWGVLGINIRGAYHFNPLDAKQVGKLTRKYGATVFLATPTFLRSYLRRCPPEDFSTLNVVVAGAEKLPTELCDAFESRFGVRPVEGYGATELSPLASVNVPKSRTMGSNQIDAKEGTVGRPIPGVSARILDLDTGKTLSSGETGMLLIKGPNVMKGYFAQPDLTAEVIQEGWYVTGDVAKIDQDGFIQITGRQSRFSKIGGEMVPHIQIEEALNALITNDDEEAGLQAAVTAVPDAKKGERLIVIHVPLAQAPGELCTKLSETGLPNLFIPAPDNFYQVDELPMLGSGKLDLKQIKQIALEKSGNGSD